MIKVLSFDILLAILIDKGTKKIYNTKSRDIGSVAHVVRHDCVCNFRRNLISLTHCNPRIQRIEIEDYQAPRNLIETVK